jgi:hypothetical protein
MSTFRIHWFLGSDCDVVFANVNVQNSLIPRVRLWCCIRQCQRSEFTDSSGQIVMLYSPMSTFRIHWFLGSDCDVVFPNVNVQNLLIPRVRLWCCISQCQRSEFTDSSGQIVMLYSPMSTFRIHWFLGSDCDDVFAKVNVQNSLIPRVRSWCCIRQC